MRIQSLFAYSPVEEMLKLAMNYVAFSRLEGDYFEFGVFEGRSFITAYHLAQAYGLNSMNFYAFDSFQGLPEIEGIDAEGFRHFKKGEFASKLDRFVENISKNAIDLSKVKVIPGWYEDVLNDETKDTLPTTRAAIIYVDCDLYKSARAVLNFITDYVQEGTIIMFDDWFCFRGNPDRGEQRAFREWLEENSSIGAIEYQRFDWQGNSFIIQRSSS
jgi:hypothetical protein